jgi:hypothetical protein
MQKLTSVNKVHQSKVNKAVKYLIKYNELNDLRNVAYDQCDEKLESRINRKCELAFDKYLDIVTELPKRERDNIEKSELY